MTWISRLMGFDEGVRVVQAELAATRGELIDARQELDRIAHAVSSLGQQSRAKNDWLDRLVKLAQLALLIVTAIYVGLTYRIADEATRAREANARPDMVLFCCVPDQHDPNQANAGIFNGGPGLALNITYRVEFQARNNSGQSGVAPNPLFLRTYDGLGGGATNTQNTTPLPVDQLRAASGTGFRPVLAAYYQDVYGHCWSTHLPLEFGNDPRGLDMSEGQGAIAEVSGGCDRRVLVSGS